MDYHPIPNGENSVGYLFHRLMMRGMSLMILEGLRENYERFISELNIYSTLLILYIELSEAATKTQK